jgi:hypothetical protein
VATELPHHAPWIAEAHSKGLAIGAVDYATRIALAAKERRISDDLNRILASRAPIDIRLTSILDLYQREMFVAGKRPDLDAVMNRFNEHVEANRRRNAMGIRTGFDFQPDWLSDFVGAVGIATGTSVWLCLTFGENFRCQ